MPFLLHSFYKHRYAFNFSYGDTEAPLSELYSSTAVQFAIQLVVHFICCLFEYLMKIPNILVWKQERKVCSLLFHTSHLPHSLFNRFTCFGRLQISFKSLPSSCTVSRPSLLCSFVTTRTRARAPGTPTSTYLSSSKLIIVHNLCICIITKSSSKISRISRFQNSKIRKFENSSCVSPS